MKKNWRMKMSNCNESEKLSIKFRTLFLNFKNYRNIRSFMISLDLKSNTTWKIKVERKEDKINKKNIRFLKNIRFNGRNVEDR